MLILVFGDAERQEDVGSRPLAVDSRMAFPGEVPTAEEVRAADAVLWLHDVLPDADTAARLSHSRLTFVNAVDRTIPDIDLPGRIVRLNAWPGFLRQPLLEIAGAADVRPAAEALLRQLGWDWRWVADTPGMVIPRILSMIVNEACLATQEGVSDPAGIDRAMQLGASYPGGPFAWSRRIGADRITALLDRLSSEDPRYTPAPQLFATLAAAR